MVYAEHFQPIKFFDGGPVFKMADWRCLSTMLNFLNFLSKILELRSLLINFESIITTKLNNNKIKINFKENLKILKNYYFYRKVKMFKCSSCS